jgi:hypothetical protein
MSDKEKQAILRPDLVREWHPTRNGDLAPHGVRPKSRRKAWWLCEKGHEWEDMIAKRTAGLGCPLCAEIRHGKCGSLAVLNPDLAGQWHPSKNRNLTPLDVRPGSKRKAWWVCDHGHEWEAMIKNRIEGRGCPECAGSKAGKDDKLSVFYPELSNQWHSEKNGKLSPRDVRPSSRRKFWWVCDHGHEWEAMISSRSAGTGCPECARKKFAEERSLAALNPELAGQWHPGRNGGFAPCDISPYSSKIVWWLCQRGHEWKMAVRSRHPLTDCPICCGKKVRENQNLATAHPEVAEYWHPTKNGTVWPEDVSSRSRKKFWWKCGQGHEWESDIKSRLSKTRCPVCSSRRIRDDNNLAAVNPVLAKEWHPTRNGVLRPQDVLPKSNRKIWWICAQGHEWQAVIGYRSAGGRCPVCAGKKAGKENNLGVEKPELAKQWHPKKNGDLSPSDFLPQSHRKVWWLCELGHEWQATILNRTNGTGCPQCFRLSRKNSR